MSELCPVCDRFVYNNPRCTCTGQSLRAEIEGLRRQVRDMALIVKNTTPEDIGMVRWMPGETSVPLWRFPDE